MFRNVFLGLVALFGVLGAHADERISQGSEPLYALYETIWQQVELLEDSDQRRLKPLFLSAVAEIQDAGLLKDWERRLGEAAEPEPPYENYALKKVSSFLEAESWDAFFERAQSRSSPFNTGRPEMMAAAAEHLADETTAAKIYQHMEAYARADTSEAAFERASFGHVLAEAAMRRCDLAAFDRAIEFTDAPNALRYAFWRARMTGDIAGLKARIHGIPDDERAMNLRQAINGVATLARLDFCGV